jgi:pimeloyl-ACP methyl ester carboxylesterase
MIWRVTCFLSQELNLAEAWDKVSVPVLAIHGEYDWVMSADDYKLMMGARAF